MKRKHLTSKQTCGTLQPISASDSTPAPGCTWPPPYVIQPTPVPAFIYALIHGVCCACVCSRCRGRRGARASCTVYSVHPARVGAAEGRWAPRDAGRSGKDKVRKWQIQIRFVINKYDLQMRRLDHDKTPAFQLHPASDPGPL